MTRERRPSRIWVRHNTGWHVTISGVWFACGWRLRVQPTAIAPYHPIRVARLDSWLKARARSSARVLKVAWRRKRLRSGGLGEPPVHRSADPTDLSRPRSSHLSQVSCQILLVPIGTAHRTPITCHVHRFASGGGPVRVRRSAGVAGGGDGCHVSRNASIWDLRLAVWSWCRRNRCLPPLSSLRRRIWRHAHWPHGHATQSKPPAAARTHSMTQKKCA